MTESPQPGSVQPDAPAAAGAPSAAETRAYRRAIAASLVLAAVGLIAAAIVWPLAGGATAGAVALGVAVGSLAALVSQVATLRSAGAAPHVFGAVVAAAWLGKMVVIVIALALLGQIADFPRAPFGVALLAVVGVNALIDLIAVRLARVPHVQPGSKSGAQ